METAARGDWLSRVRGPRLAVALLLSVFLGGTIGYVLIEGWSAWDGFDMTATTVGTAFYTFTLLATVIVEGGLAAPQA